MSADARRFRRAGEPDPEGDWLLMAKTRSEITDPPTLRHRSNRTERRSRRYGKISEAAEYLGVTERTIRQMIADGRLTGYRCGTRLVRVDLDEVDAVMQPFGGAA